MKDSDNRLMLKIAGYFTLVVGIIWCVTVIGAILGIPLIIGGNKFITLSKKEDYHKDKDTILILSILFLIFSFLIPGILGIIVYINLSGLLNNNSADKIKEKLAEIEKLKEDGTITKEEYKKMREKILS